MTNHGEMLEETVQGYDAETNRALKEVIKLKKSMERTTGKGKERSTNKAGKAAPKGEKKG